MNPTGTRNPDARLAAAEPTPTLMVPVTDAKRILREWADHYPVDLFPPPGPEESTSRGAAAMARHLCDVLVDDLLRASVMAAESGEETER